MIMRRNLTIPYIRLRNVQRTQPPFQNTIKIRTPPLTSLGSPTQHTLTNPLPTALRQNMILRISSSLIQHLHRLPIQLHKLALESQVKHLTNILSMIVCEEQTQRVRVPKQCPPHRNILYIIRLTQL